MKIGQAGNGLSSALRHEYNIYRSLAGSVGISLVHWYGKEDLCEVLVLENLGTSIGDLINNEQPSYEKMFFYASEMVSSR